MRNIYQSKSRKFQVLGSREVAVHLPLPLAEVWEQLQVEAERLAGRPGCGLCTASWKRE